MGLFDDLIPGGGSARPGMFGGGVKASDRAQKRYNDLALQGEAARDQFGNLVRAYGLTQSVPTGVIPNAINTVRRAIGAGDSTVQDNEQLGALADQMVMGLRQPGAGAISDTERASFRGSLFSPKYQPEANRGIIDAQIGHQLSDLARAKIAEKWRARYGSLDAVAPTGQSYDAAVSKFFASQEGQKALRPFSQRLSEKRQAPVTSGIKITRVR
jgi:hypothetical protein